MAAKGSTNSSKPPIILRKRTFLTHTTPIDVNVTEEFTLINYTDNDQKYVLLTSPAYRPGMRVLDEDGTELGLLPNEDVRELLEEAIRQGDKDAQPLLDAMNNHTQYVRWISIPAARPFKPYQIRIIKFISTLLEDKPAKVEKIPLKQRILELLFRLELFDIPKFRITEEFSVKDPPSKFVVLPPEGFIVEKTYDRLQAQTNGLSRDVREGEEHYHITSRPNVVDANIPAIPNSKLDFVLKYEIRLHKTEERQYSTFIIALVAFSVFFALAVTNILPTLTFSIPTGNTSVYTAPITSRILSQETLVTTAIIFTALAFIGLTSNKITNPTKYWALLAIIITVLGVLLAPSPIG